MMLLIKRKKSAENWQDTMNEFTNLIDMGKVIGVLRGTGGIADELEQLTKKINKPSKAKVIFHDSPKELVQEVLKELAVPLTIL